MRRPKNFPPLLAADPAEKCIPIRGRAELLPAFLPGGAKSAEENAFVHGFGRTDFRTSDGILNPIRIQSKSESESNPNPRDGQKVIFFILFLFSSIS